MQAIKDDPDIRQAGFSLEDKLTLEQIRLVGSSLRNLINRYETYSRDAPVRPIDWPEWDTFLETAYACGFVCSDAGTDMGDDMKTPVVEVIEELKRSPVRLEELGLRDLRRILHYILRRERWSDGGRDTGGGAVWDLITSRLGDALARRLGA
jgi:hypothetical protein